MIPIIVCIIFFCLNYKQAHAQATISTSKGEHFAYDIIMFTTSASDLMLGQAADNAQVKGMLIPISYLDPENRDTACSRFQLGFAESICSYPNSQFKYSWIALVRRGACALTEKVRNAQAIGAMAIVVSFQ
jgi:hypothetical protein